MDFLLTVQRRGLMAWDQNAEKEFRAKLLEEQEAKERKWQEENPKKKLIVDNKRRRDINKAN